MNPFIAELAKILEVPEEAVKPSFLLENGVWDSMSMLSCMGAIETFFKAEINTASLWKCRTVGDVLKLIPQ